MRALFDVSMLLALFDSGHVHHARALDWWKAERERGWASCPISQHGFLRIVSQPSYPRPVVLATAVAALERQIGAGGHEFWPDDVAILDTARVDRSRLLGPRQLTDVYLLALAVKHGGRLVTLDRGITRAAVRGAEPQHLVMV